MIETLNNMCTVLSEYNEKINIFNIREVLRRLYRIIELVESNKDNLHIGVVKLIISEIKIIQRICNNCSVSIYTKNQYVKTNYKELIECLATSVVQIIADYKKFESIEQRLINKVPDDILTKPSFDESLILKQPIRNKNTGYLLFRNIDGKITPNGLFRLYLHIANVTENRGMLEFVLDNKHLILDSFIPKSILESVSIISPYRVISIEQTQDNIPTGVICVCLINKNQGMFRNPVIYLDTTEDVRPFCCNMFTTDWVDAEFSLAIGDIVQKDMETRLPLTSLLYYSIKMMGTGYSEVEQIKQIQVENNYLPIKFEPEVDMVEDLRNTLVLLLNNMYINQYEYEQEISYIQAFIDMTIKPGAYLYLVSNEDWAKEIRLTFIKNASYKAIRRLSYFAYDYLSRICNIDNMLMDSIVKTFPNPSCIWNDDETLNKHLANTTNVCVWIVFAINKIENEVEQAYSRVFIKKCIQIINLIYLSPVNYFELTRTKLGMTETKLNNVLNNLASLIFYDKQGELLGEAVTTVTNRTTSLYNRILLNTDNKYFKKRFYTYPERLPARMGEFMQSQLDNKLLTSNTVLVFYLPDLAIPLYYDVLNEELDNSTLIQLFNAKINKRLSTQEDIYIEIDKLYHVKLEKNKFVYIMDILGNAVENREEYSINKTSIFEVKKLE